MKMNERMKKVFSVLLTVCMVLSYIPTTAFAAEADNLCEHHTEHTVECGYAEGVSDCAYHCEICLGHDHGDASAEPSTEATTEATEPSTEATEPSTEATEPSTEETEPSTEATEPAPVCDCGTDDPSIHATTCAVYVAPENPVCFCAEKCTEPNVWCDICGFDVSACEGTDAAAGYELSYDENGTCLIATADDLYAFAELVNGGRTYIYAKLTANIVVNENVLNADGTLNGDGSNFRVWTPIGNGDYSYSATFDGDGFTVSGLYYNAEADNVGLFGVQEGHVYNVGVVDSYISGGKAVGGVVGLNKGEIKRCWNASSIKGTYDVGGVVGSNYYDVGECYNTGAVNGIDQVGGVVGKDCSADSDVSCCYSTGTVSGTGALGGVLGGAKCGRMYYCYYLNTSCTGGINGQDAQGAAESKTAEQFASGEVAYLMNYSVSSDIWYQTCGEGLPDFSGQRVYYCKRTCTDEDMVYTNQLTSHSGDGSYAPTNDGTRHTITYSCCGDVVTEDHTVAASYQAAEDDTQHTATYSCCGGVVTEDHTVAASYQPTEDGTQHIRTYSCCGISVTEDHAVSVSYTPTENGARHNVTYSCCGGVVTEDHTVAASYTLTEDGSHHIANYSCCGAAVTGDHASSVDSSCGGIKLCEVCKKTYGDADGSGHNSAIAYDNGFCPNGCYEPAELVGDVYQITNAGNLYWFAAQVNSGNNKINAILTDNIVDNEHVLDADGDLDGAAGDFRHWTPIGFSQSYEWGSDVTNYEGVFDGNGKTISGLYVPDYADRYTHGNAFIGQNAGTVKNLGLLDSYVISDATAGGIVDGNADTGIISGCYNAATINCSESYAGGIAASSSGRIENCYNTGKIIGNGDAGGIVGQHIDGGIVSKCYNLGSVSGYSRVGGIAGGQYTIEEGDPVIQDCYNSAAVTGQVGYVGGILGYSDKGSLVGCYNTGRVTGRNYVGGIVGCLYGGTVESSCYLTGCAKDSSGTVQNGTGAETSGSATADTSATTALTAAQFASGKATWLLNCADSDGAWRQTLGTQSYPQYEGSRVYKISCAGVEGEFYSNQSKDYGTHDFVGGRCTRCNACDHTGSTHTTAKLHANNISHVFICTICGEESAESHSFDDEGNCICNVEAVILVSGNTTTYYGDLNKALNAAKENDSVYALADYGGSFTIPSMVNFYGGGTFTATVHNYGIIHSGTFSDTVTNGAAIYGGTFNSKLINTTTGFIYNTTDNHGPYVLGVNFVLENNGTIHCTKHITQDGVCCLCGADCGHTDGDYVNGICPNGCYEPAELVDGVYQIGNLGQLMWFAKNVSTAHKVILTADITIDNSVVWTPISLTDGTDNSSTFNGGGHTITFANTNKNSDFGLFATYNYSIIENLYLAGSFTCENTGVVGALVNSAYRTTIRKVISTCDITNTASYGSVGGLAGRFGGQDSDGLYSLIENCAVYADVIGGGSAGGLIGNIWDGQQYCTVKNCAYVGNAKSGAIVGYNSNDSSTTSTFSDVYFCEADGIGWIGSADSGLTSLTNVEAKSAEAFASGEVAYLLGEAWGQTIGTDSYPVIGGETVYQITDCSENIGYSNVNQSGNHKYSDNGFCIGCDGYQPAVKNSSGYYKIGNAGNLYWFAQLVNETGSYSNCTSNAILIRDITVNEGTMSANSTGVRTWEPIGLADFRHYAGTFEGNGNTISGLFCNRNGYYAGLFCYVGEKGKVQNLTVANSYFCNEQRVGGVVCYNNGTVTNCANSSTVSGTLDIGGIVGRNYGIVSNCYNSGSVSGSESSVGGVVGYNWDTGSISNCYYLDSACSGGIRGADVTGSAEAKTAAQFASGEVAYLLQGEQETHIWGQTCGEGYPTLGGPKVNYGYTTCDESQTAPIYTNEDTTEEKPGHTGGTATCTAKAVCEACGDPYGELLAHNFGTDGTCANGCGTACDHSGSIHTAVTPNGSTHSFTCTVCGGTGSEAHTVEPTYAQNVDDSTKHDVNYSCCGATVAEAHDHTGGKCVCGVKATPEVTAPAAVSGLVYSGEAQTLIIAGSVSGGTMQYKAGDGAWSTDLPKATNAGEYTVSYKVVGDDNYNDVAEQSITVTIGQKDLAGATVTLDETTFTYDGQPHKPGVTVTLDGKELTEGTDYKVTYRRCRQFEGGKPIKWWGDEDCINASTDYYAVVEGLGNYYTENNTTLYAGFIINPKEVTDPTFDGLEAWYLHTGEAIEPTFTLMDGTTEIPADEYTVAYTDNTELGTATITITDKDGGNYAVSGTATFQIAEHAHDWSYAASGDTITATCVGTIGSCPVENNTVTITLVAPADLSYDGQTKSVTISQDPAGVFADLPNVVYTGDCKSTGEHTASLTYGGFTATLTFTITCEHTDAAGDENHTCDKGCGAENVTGHTWEDATCNAPKTCSECGETTGEALSHTDENTDHICDRNCGKEDIGTHADSATDNDHLCDYGCGATLEECSDSDNDGNHNCDVCGEADITGHNYAEATCTAPKTCSECGGTTGEALSHVDENKDHECDRNCGKTDMGVHADSDTDTDHICDYGCGATLEDCSDKTGDNNHDCDVCGAKNVSQHTYGDANCDTPATCTECGETTGEALGHIDENTDHICDRNCGKTDIGTHADADKDHDCDYGCDTAIGTHADSAADNDHVCDYGCGATLEDCSYVAGEYTWNADYSACTVTGTCVCGATTTATAEVKSEQTKAPTCAAMGETTYTATFKVDWAETQTKTVEDVPATGEHSYATEVEGTRVAATCMAAGSVTMKCACGAAEDQTLRIDPDNHTGVNHTENAVEATCGSEGYTGDTVCECGKTVAEGEVIPATGEHDYVDGTCTVCGDEDPDYDEPGKPGWGNIWDWIFGGWWGEEEKCDHSYTAVVTNPTCTNQGYTTYTCSKCGDSYEDSYTDALGHAWDSGKVTEEATCTEDGVKTYTCAACGETRTEAIKAAGHKFEDGICAECGEEEASKPTEPSEPQKPHKPSWGNIWDWIGCWWK